MHYINYVFNVHVTGLEFLKGYSNFPLVREGEFRLVIELRKGHLSESTVHVEYSESCQFVT